MNNLTSSVLIGARLSYLSMGSQAVQLMLKATPFLRCRKFADVRKRFYAVKSSLEPPDVAKLADAARISLTPKEVEEFAPKIQQVVDWFGQLQAVDLESIEPALRADTDGADNLRDDVPELFDHGDAIIAAVPNYEDPYIKVPKVLNKDC